MGAGLLFTQRSLDLTIPGLDDPWTWRWHLVIPISNLSQPFLCRMYWDTWDYPGMSLVRVTDYTSWIPKYLYPGYLRLSWDVPCEGNWLYIVDPKILVSRILETILGCSLWGWLTIHRGSQNTCIQDTWDYPGMFLVRVTDYTSWIPKYLYPGYLRLSWDVPCEGDWLYIMDPGIRLRPRDRAIHVETSGDSPKYPRCKYSWIHNV